MAKYNFEGDIENISEQQLEFIHKVIVENGFENNKVIFEPVGKAGDNYVANVKRLIIEGENKKKLIVKIAPTFELIRQAMNFYVMFQNEHIIYTEVLPKFEQLEKEAGVPEEERLKFAKCYGSTCEQPYEVLILEDLNELNFIMLDRFGNLSNECVKSVLRNFAKLHSLSFVLRHKEPEMYENFKTKLLDLWTIMSDSQDFKMMFVGMENDMLTVIDDPEKNQILKHKATEMSNLSLKLSKADSDSKYTIIQQGDAWTNNILFKFEDDKVDSIMIDYQNSKNISPVYDIMYMIFNCTDYETRKLYFYDWIDYYHAELENSLNNFGLKTSFIYPRDKLDADLKRYGKFSFAACVVLSNMLVRKNDEAAKLKDSMQDGNMAEQMQAFSLLKMDEESKTMFKNKIFGLIASFTEFGLL